MLAVDVTYFFILVIYQPICFGGSVSEAPAYECVFGHRHHLCVFL